MSCLLIDSGNSRVKWGWSADSGVEGGTAVGYTDAERISALWAALPAADQVWLTNSAGEQRLQWLQQRITQYWGRQAEVAVTGARWSTLINGYRNPQQLGVDRWLGMVAAWSRLQSAFCLIDCGTAVTVDFVDATGIHQGGNIFPGVGSTMAQLLQHAPHLKKSYRVASGVLLGKSTEEALMAAEEGTEQRISRILEALQQRYGGFELLLTGGAAERLFLEGQFQRFSDLVLEGLSLVAHAKRSGKT